MTKKWSIGLIALFMFVLSLTIGFYASATAGLGDPIPHRKCLPGDFEVFIGQCCPAPNNGLGVYTASGCYYEDNIGCSCTGIYPEGGGNPYGCPLECGVPR